MVIALWSISFSLCWCINIQIGKGKWLLKAMVMMMMIIRGLYAQKMVGCWGDCEMMREVIGGQLLRELCDGLGQIFCGIIRLDSFMWILNDGVMLSTVVKEQDSIKESFCGVEFFSDGLELRYLNVDDSLHVSLVVEKTR